MKPSAPIADPERIMAKDPLEGLQITDYFPESRIVVIEIDRSSQATEAFRKKLIEITQGPNALTVVVNIKDD
jgi:hypothetical protein